MSLLHRCVANGADCLQLSPTEGLPPLYVRDLSLSGEKRTYRDRGKDGGNEMCNWAIGLAWTNVPAPPSTGAETAACTRSTLIQSYSTSRGPFNKPSAAHPPLEEHAIPPQKHLTRIISTLCANAHQKLGDFVFRNTRFHFGHSIRKSQTVLIHSRYIIEELY